MFSPALTGKVKFCVLLALSLLCKWRQYNIKINKTILVNIGMGIIKNSNKINKYKNISKGMKKEGKYSFAKFRPYWLIRLVIS